MRTTATIGQDITFPLEEVSRLNTLNNYRHNTDSSSGFVISVGSIIESIRDPFGGWINSGFSIPSTQNTDIGLGLSTGNEIESGNTQEIVDMQILRRAYPSYDDEDILYWDVAITPPPRPSHKIRVKLKFKGRRKPMPIENPWEG